MKKIILVAVLAALAGCAKDDNNTNSESQLNNIDSNFTTKATMGNMAEISAGQTAVNKGTSADIRNFGQLMMTDHGPAKDDLKTIANSLSLYAPDSLDAQSVALEAELSSLTGRLFDSVYIHSQVDMHQQTISLFQAEINNGLNKRLKSYANDLLPHLKSHLQNAQSIANAY